MPSPPVRIAMWSGPRNISTALMRSFGNRDDTVVVDEPLYAHYLRETGLDHPGAAEVIAAGETDWRRVVEALTAGEQGDARIHYQKHMAHHLLPSIGREWLGRVRHAFLIRDPAAMLASLARKLPRVTLADTGLEQQVEIFAAVGRQAGRPPPVIDARDVLADPRGVLGLLCASLDIPFQEAMLSWPRGPRATDGVWARHWYAAVEDSTGFQARGPDADPEVPPSLRGVLDRCRALYARLDAVRLH